MEKRANLIYIVSDTLRADYLGCYGNDFIHTPNLDAFAAESVGTGHSREKVAAVGETILEKRIHFPFGGDQPGAVVKVIGIGVQLQRMFLFKIIIGGQLPMQMGQFPGLPGQSGLLDQFHGPGTAAHRYPGLPFAPAIEI